MKKDLRFSKRLVSDAAFLSNEVYDDDAESCAQRGLELVYRDTSTETEVFVYYKPSQETLLVSFRGTSSWSDVVTDAKVFYAKRSTGIRLHAGFNTAYNRVVVTLSGFVINWLVRNKQIKKVLFTGHSLGGALAHVALVDQKEALETLGVSVRGVTFGQPRVFTKGTLKHETYTKLKIEENLLRVVNGSDKVTEVPYEWMGYRHDGIALELNTTRFSVLGLLHHSIKLYGISLATMPDQKLAAYLRCYDLETLSDEFEKAFVDNV